MATRDHRAAAREALHASDPAMAALMDRVGFVDLDAWRSGWALDPFRALARSVVGQQMAYGLDAIPTERAVRDLGERRSPNRSLATAFLYRSLES